MLELGNPLHIFDHDRIKGEQLTVKASDASFKFETLDGMNRDIPPQTILVCDEEKVLSLAGIMGGLHSAATEITQNILIEAASFSPQWIRRSSRLLDLKTDASSRFDRGIDQEAILRALERATELILEVAGGEACPIIDHYPIPSKPRTIPCRVSKIEHLLGFSLSLGEIIEIFKRLEMEVSQDKTGILHVTVPSYRNDLTIEADLVEEVARLYGYNNIPRHCPIYSAGALHDSPLFSLEKETRTLLLQEGLQECVTCDLISPQEHLLSQEKGLPESATLRVLHPRSVDQSILRTSLLPGLLKAAQHNLIINKRT